MGWGAPWATSLLDSSEGMVGAGRETVYRDQGALGELASGKLIHGIMGLTRGLSKNVTLAVSRAHKLPGLVECFPKVITSLIQESPNHITVVKWKEHKLETTRKMKNELTPFSIDSFYVL